MPRNSPPESTFRVRRPGTLLDALEHMFAGRSRRDLRRLVHEQRIRLNGEAATSLDAPVGEGDLVECLRSGRARSLAPNVTLLHEDAEFLIVDKGVGILTSGGAPRGPRTVADVLDRHLGGGRRRAHPCHRLDRDVSGVLAFATSDELAQEVRSDVRRWLSERVYVALVEGTPEPREGTIRSYLADGDDQVVRTTTEAAGGKLAVSHYRVVEADERFALVEVRLETGRKNQIRVHLGELGHPIVGDLKYGARGDPIGRIALHARRLVLTNPRTGERLAFDSPVPFGLGRVGGRPERRG